MYVYALPIYVFNDKLETFEKTFKNSFYLSIRNPCDLDKTPIREDSDNFKTVWIYDIEDDLYNDGVLVYEKPSRDVLENIVDFIVSNFDKSEFFVHCSAGVSRSGAIATFTQDLFGSVSYERFKQMNKNIVPNYYILKTMREIYNEKYFDKR